MSDMMSMTLHGGNREFILFKFWKTGSTLGMGASLIIVILMCILFEALKALRVFLAKIHFIKRHEIARTVSANIAEVRADRMDSTSNDALNFPPLLRFAGHGRVFTPYRILQAFLYAVQVTLAYVLMLVVMTFNLWLLIAVVVGEAIGYFLFTGEPIVSDCSSSC
ncbi:unnamed protein product [Enterobius vermicularis]|uniref:Copper transport protein n=1 Tax=Enterobius vermicularis TaxID=51028 RepID=A0A0N4UUM1_ENTVE|nr:unnamed protein product [Enterobius vermicularis]